MGGTGLDTAGDFIGANAPGVIDGIGTGLSSAGDAICSCDRRRLGSSGRNLKCAGFDIVDFEQFHRQLKVLSPNDSEKYGFTGGADKIQWPGAASAAAPSGSNYQWLLGKANAAKASAGKKNSNKPSTDEKWSIPKAPSFSMPSVSLPSVSLPSVSMPDVDLSGVGDTLGDIGSGIGGALSDGY